MQRHLVADLETVEAYSVCVCVLRRRGDIHTVPTTANTTFTDVVAKGRICREKNYLYMKVCVGTACLIVVGSQYCNINYFFMIVLYLLHYLIITYYVYGE